MYAMDEITLLIILIILIAAALAALVIGINRLIFQIIRKNKKPIPRQEVSKMPEQSSTEQKITEQNTTNINITHTNTPAKSPKNRWIALILCFFFGFLGIHRFYVGKVGTGILYIFTGGFFLIGVIIDFFMILFGSFTDKSRAFLK